MITRLVVLAVMMLPGSTRRRPMRPVDGRLNGAPVQLQLGGLDGRLVRLDGALVLALAASSVSIVSFETTPASKSAL